MMPESYLLIITVGPQRSGLISEITSVVAGFAYNIEDIDQVVMHGTFILSVMVNISDRPENLDRLRSKIESRCRELGLEVKFYYPSGK